MSRYLSTEWADPKEHDEETRAALRAAAEPLVAAGRRRRVVGADGSSRGGHDHEGRLQPVRVEGGPRRRGRPTAFEYLYDEIDRLPKTDDPAADLIAIGTEAVRRLALDHPGLFRIAFQRVAGLHADPGLVAARGRPGSSSRPRSSA